MLRLETALSRRRSLLEWRASSPDLQRDGLFPVSRTSPPSTFARSTLPIGCELLRRGHFFSLRLPALRWVLGPAVPVRVEMLSPALPARLPLVLVGIVRPSQSCSCSSTSASPSARGTTRRAASPPPLQEIRPLLLPLRNQLLHVSSSSLRRRDLRGTCTPPLGDFGLHPVLSVKVAGSIKRFRGSAPSCARAPRWPTWPFGVTRILAGLTKKHIMADTFALFAANYSPTCMRPRPARSPAESTPTESDLFDFSEYSDIAIGSGYCSAAYNPRELRLALPQPKHHGLMATLALSLVS